MALGALPRCWALLAGVSGGIKLYLGFIIIIKIYPTLSTAVGGQDGMDCSRCLWMTCSIIRTHHRSWRLGVLVVEDFGHIFVQQYIYVATI